MEGQIMDSNLTRSIYILLKKGLSISSGQRQKKDVITAVEHLETPPDPYKYI